MNPPVVVLPVSRPDFHLAIKWIKWATALHILGGEDYPLLVFAAKSLSEDSIKRLAAEIHAAGAPSGWMYVIQEEEYEHPELGYGAAANLMLRGAFEACEKHFPDRPILWCEADAIPTRSMWHEEISREYAFALECGKHLLADFHPYGEKPHCTGVAVYPANWRELIPGIATLPAPEPREGWDSSLRAQTIPISYRSSTIQQIWEAPRFNEGRMAMLHPCTSLFHRDKTGTLIDVLANRLGLARIPIEAPIAAPTSRLASARDGRSEPGEPTFKCEILIVSHEKDMDYLRYCIRSVLMHAAAFSGITLVVPACEKNLYGWVPKTVKVIFQEETPGKGMLHHLIAKSRADELCPHADAIMLLDADCMAWRGFNPGDYFPNRKALMVRERYDEVLNPNRLYWQKCVEKAVGFAPNYETMCRHPAVFFREVFKRTRDLVELNTGMKFNEYVLSGPNAFPQSYCEINTLGAVAIREFADKYHFVDYDRSKDARECGQDYHGSWQYIYRKERECIVEFWSHAPILRYEKLMQEIMLGKAPEYYVK